MTELDTRILGHLATANALTGPEIAQDLGAAIDATRAALHRLDDAGHVLMRNGLYRLSEAARAARQHPDMTRPGDVIHE
jgi:DNA-binding transcriptional regulator PaaX